MQASASQGSTPGDASVPASAHLAALRWLLLSAPLVVAPPEARARLAHFDASERAGMVQWLTSQQTHTHALLAWMQTKPEVRIGRYAERLLEFYLLYAPAHATSPAPLHTLLAAHVPLRTVVSGLKVTQGELDFLLTNARGEHLHWELAVKFFLCTAEGDVATPTDFIGPNGVETLAHKWHKLFARQLTHTPPAPWNAHPWQPQAFTRGWMFYCWGREVPLCDALHPQHGRGWWVDAAGMQALPEAHYAYLPRLHWLAPVESLAQLGPHAVVLERDAMAAHLRNVWANGARAADAHMLVQLADDAALSETSAEVQRFFVRPQV